MYSTTIVSIHVGFAPLSITIVSIHADFGPLSTI